MMNLLVKSILVFGLLTLVENRERLESDETIRDEKEEHSSKENENFGDFISKLRTVDGRSRHLSEETKKSTSSEDQSLAVLSGCLQQSYKLLLHCQVKELAKLVENPPKPVCPPNFIHLRPSNKCYKLEFEQMDWKDARIRCKNLHRDAHLVVVDDASEQAAIVTYLTSLKDGIQTSCTEEGMVKVWTAGQRIDPMTKSKFVWKPNTNTIVDMEYTNWVSGQPDFASNKESCVHFYSFPDLKWNDIGCELVMQEITGQEIDPIFYTNNARCVKSI